MKILHSGDWHILLKKKNVPYEWQKNRFEMLFEELFALEKECDIHIMAGDLFDKRPTEDEVALALKFFNRASIPTYIIPGNHEATKKGESFLKHFTEDNVISNPNVTIITKNEHLDIGGLGFQFFPYGEMQLDKLPEYVEGDVLVSHIRGEVPPHITPEYDFEKLRPWRLILLADLHFNHQYQDFPAFYPGSPVNVVFDRSEDREYGVNIVTLDEDTYSIDFRVLDLPKLLRRTITTSEEMEKHPVHHVVYEVTGSIDELALIKNSDLLDKKISHKVGGASKLNLTNKTDREELVTYLEYKKISNVDKVLEEFDNL